MEGRGVKEGGRGRRRGDNYRYNQVYRPEACIGFSDIPPTNNCSYCVLYKMYLMPSMYLLSIQYTIHTLYFHPRTLTLFFRSFWQFKILSALKLLLRVMVSPLDPLCLNDQ